MSRRSALLVSAMATALLSACASPGQRAIERDIAGSEAAATGVKANAKQLEPYFHVTDEIYIGGTGVAIKQRTALDSRLEETVSFQRLYPVTLSAIAEFVTTEFGVPMRVTADAFEAARSAVYDPGEQFLNEGTGRNSESPGQARGAGGQPGGAQDAMQQASFIVQYEGKLKGFLDLIAARTGNGWRADGDTVTLFNRDTRTWEINTLPGASQLNATISNQSTGGSAGGGGGAGGQSGAQTQLQSGNTTTASADIDVFAAAADAVEQMLSPRGAVAKSAALGSITVTDEAYILDRVDAYLRDVNARVTRQVELKVDVYSVELSQTESYGIDWDLVWKSLDGRYQGVTQLSAAPVEGANSISVSIIDRASRAFGSTALVSALSQQGNVTIETSAMLNTLSGQPVPVQIGDETSYLADRSVVLTENATQITQRLGTIASGASITALPVVMANNEILLQLQLNLNQLRELRVVGDANNRLEAPQVDTRQTLQRVRIGSGNTLILAGFEQDRLRADARGIGNPKFALAGGGRTGDRRRTMLVVVVTPRVVG